MRLISRHLSKALNRDKKSPVLNANSGYEETIKARMANAARDWTEGTQSNPESAAARFKQGGFFDVRVSPRFSFDRTAKIYTIGSCFARNVEESLAAAGARVPTSELDVDFDIYIRKPRFRTTVLNKYNPATMASEIMRGLGEETFPNYGLLQLGEDKWYDPQASHVGAMSWEQAVKLRTTLDSVSRHITDCDVVLMTLGLTETWWDTEIGVAFNALNPVLLRPRRDRLRFGNVTVEAAYESLAKALMALRRRNPSAKVVVTVSPVPLLNTFTSMDVVSANAYSKATLRVVAQRLYESFDFVDYFPSYEMVTNSERSFAWHHDQAHVSNDVVDMVIGRFMDEYVG